jgi:hypothetical protein
MNNGREYEDDRPEGAGTDSARDPRRRFPRSGFLAKMGAGGLVAAATMFGRIDTALAAVCGCCNLANCPANTSWAYCTQHAGYIWYCTGPVYKCGCCETPGCVKSAFTCA